MNAWVLRYEGFDPETERLRESLCTLGNGRFATRGAAPEARPDGVHYPGCYAAGLFNRVALDVDGHHVEHESLVNLPDWQSLTFRVAGGSWLAPGEAELSDYVQELDLRRGVLTRRFRVTDAEGKVTAVSQRRLVSMADPFAAGLSVTLVAVNYSGLVEVRSGLDGRVTNSGVPRYAGLGNEHLRTLAAEVVGEGLLSMLVETNQSRMRVGLAARQRVVNGRGESLGKHTAVQAENYVAEDVAVELAEGQSATLEKVVSLFTSRDRAVSEPASAALEKAACLPEFGQLLERHVLAWDHLWARVELEIAADQHTELALHLHLFHLLQTVSAHVVDLDVGIPARGLHGEAYRGHIFWDETFVFPFLTLRMPELAEALLLYRWRRLPQARRAAADAGHRGAMFPWQSGSDGREETPELHLNPQSGRWLPDNSRLQRHINVAVAYNTWQYYQATGDLDFLSQYGAELILEIAKFFSSLAVYDATADRYDIRGVMGPDEYHDGYPWREKPGLDNNAYTNVMVVWVLLRAMECLEVLPERRRDELVDLLDIRREDQERWEHLSRKMRLCWHGEGILSQFEGYERLEEFGWQDYIERYGDIARLDRILEAEGDSPNRYRLSKQADVLMLFYLLSAEELTGLLHRLGYPHDPALIPRNVDYYLARTSHGSTLSKVVHAWVLARSNRTQAWQLLREALDADIADTQGGTTAEGIHLGAMAGTVDLVQRGFTGLETRADRLRFDPCLPAELTSLRFRLRYREHYGIEVLITQDELVVSGRRGAPSRLRLVVGEQEYDVDPGGARQVQLQRPPSPTGPAPTVGAGPVGMPAAPAAPSDGTET